ncbi:MAG: Na+/H+ antiporter NhaA [Acidimicrobiia bacterium]|nr:Na+/H+ antiporter NhaA [Acidimicrobiia bacterium]MDH3462584.1 Na+/H+ antiporter NhaA [Acidimicrobiia bacterium]
MEPSYDTWVTSDRFLAKNFVRPFVRFTNIEASSGIVLLVAAVAAIIWANSAASGSYFAILEEHLDITLGGFHFEESVLEIINDGLMAIFFFVVGLEIKRELVLGDLRDPKAAALPVMAALGGMIVPALVYVAFNAGTPAAHGWGIPMATDIAFAVGVVALLGSRVPPGAKLFLLALAIADDIGAITVIAIFYTADLSIGYLGLAIAGLVLVWLAQRANIRALAFYIPLAFVIWYFTLESGVHATLAGVSLGFLTPARPYFKPKEFDQRARAILDQFPLEPESTAAQERADYEVVSIIQTAQESISPLNRLEHNLVGWSSYLIVPLFALANAGVDFRGSSIGETATSAVALGVALGLLVGKTFGISLFTYAAVRLGMGRLPAGTGWGHVIGLAAVAGVGFTVSLFVAGLAFTDPHTIDLAKIGIFTGSLASGILGSVVLLRTKSPTTKMGHEPASP